ncbi:hypothetical protein, partial [Nonomuraea insulae]
MTEHQQLNLLGQISADQYRQQTEQVPHQPVDQRQQHLAMVPAAALIAQRNPSSQYETVFPSGTGTGQVFLTKHQQLNILGQISAGQHRQQTEQVPHQPVDQRQQHLAMLAAAALIAQRNPSSQRQTMFPSGTRHAKPSQGHDVGGCNFRQ